MKLVIDLDDTWSQGESISAAIKESIEAEINKEVRKLVKAAVDENKSAIIAVANAYARRMAHGGRGREGTQVMANADADALREALWICVEHNALHFGETHNTVVQGRAALASAAQRDLLRPAEPPTDWDGCNFYERTELIK